MWNYADYFRSLFAKILCYSSIRMWLLDKQNMEYFKLKDQI